MATKIGIRIEWDVSTGRKPLSADQIARVRKYAHENARAAFGNGHVVGIDQFMVDGIKVTVEGDATVVPLHDSDIL